MPRLSKHAIRILNSLCQSNVEYTLREIAVIVEKTNNPRLPIYSHYIEQLVKLGLVTSTKRMYKNYMTTFYMATSQSIPESVTCKDDYLLPGMYAPCIHMN